MGCDLASDRVTVAPTHRPWSSNREEISTLNQRSVAGLWQGTSTVIGPGRSPTSAARMAPATSAATGSFPAPAQACRYDTPVPMRAGSPPLAAAKACHAALTQVITPSRSSSATSTPTSGPAGTRPAGEAPAEASAALAASDLAARAASTEG